MENDIYSIEKEDLDVKLIEGIQEYDFIYNKQNRQHKDKQKIKNAWLELSKKLNSPVHILQQRWLNLRQRFSKERRLLPSCSDSKSTWKHFDSLQFLDSVVKRRSHSSYYVSSTDTTDSTHKTDYSDASIDVIDVVDAMLIDDIPGNISPLLERLHHMPPPTVQNHSPTAPNKRKVDSIEESSAIGLKLKTQKLEQLVQLSSKEPDMDINTAFSQYVGQALKTKSIERQKFLRTEFWRLLEEH